MAGVREDDCEWEHGFHPLPRGARGLSEYHEAENSAFQVFIPINSDLLLLHAGSEFMGMLNLEAGGFLQIRLP